ncbi:hypothetical protein TNCV_3101811 [Trichonephila clavipes]|nr:hypothetical protein TNCV_3101811 [Trichonephila clavipes]
MNPIKKEILKEQIEELLRQNIIEECESHYATPVVLVPKQNGKVRLCVDYRKLKSVTKVDTYPLPRMDDLLNEATLTSYMSTIDLQLGYHQVKVADVDQDKTAFICPFGTYCYLAYQLSSLTKKVQWHSSTEQQESFETLKMCLITFPILKQADESKPFTIHTDPSNYALGVVLFQGSSPDEYAIEYASCLMIPTEQNYSTIEREALR